MIIARRVIRQNQQASFNALIYGVAGLGSLGLGALYGRGYEFRRKQRKYLGERPILKSAVMGTIAPEVAVGNAIGRVFSRRRRTKNGKVVIEQVRRK